MVYRVGFYAACCHHRLIDVQEMCSICPSLYDNSSFIIHRHHEHQQGTRASYPRGTKESKRRVLCATHHAQQSGHIKGHLDAEPGGVAALDCLCVCVRVCVCVCVNTCCFML